MPDKIDTARAFPLEIVLSLSTGCLFCEFAALHEAAEWLLGRSIWTHEFADETTVRLLKEAVTNQHPELAAFDASAVTRENWRGHLETAKATFGKTVSMRQARAPRTEGPLESLSRLAPGKPTIVVEAKP